MRSFRRKSDVIFRKETMIGSIFLGIHVIKIYDKLRSSLE